MSAGLRQQLAEFLAIVFLKRVGHVEQHGVGFFKSS
jgi:hypothetical protein